MPFKSIVADLSEIRNSKGEPLIILAIKNDSIDVVDFLINNKIYSPEDSYELSENEKNKLLEGFKPCVTYDGDDYNYIQSFKKSLAAYAAESNNIYILRFLLSICNLKDELYYSYYHTVYISPNMQ